MKKCYPNLPLFFLDDSLRERKPKTYSPPQPEGGFIINYIYVVDANLDHVKVALTVSVKSYTSTGTFISPL